MRRFLPYLKYLRPVRAALMLGIVCGAISGGMVGLGLPLVIKYVIPRVLVPDSTPVQSSSSPARPGGFLHGLMGRADRFLDNVLPPKPQDGGSEAAQPAATVGPASVPAAAVAARPKLTALQLWLIALWLPLVFVVRGVAG